MGKYNELKKRLQEKDEIIRCLQVEKLKLEDMIADLTKPQETECIRQKDGKTYVVQMRMVVYDALVNGVPTKNIPVLIKKYSERLGHPGKDVPHRNSEEQMARELGVISDLQTAWQFHPLYKCTRLQGADH